MRDRANAAVKLASSLDSDSFKTLVLTAGITLVVVAALVALVILVMVVRAKRIVVGPTGLEYRSSHDDERDDSPTGKA